MIDPQSALEFLSSDGPPSEKTLEILKTIGFDDLQGAVARFRALCRNDSERALFSQIFSALSYALMDATSADHSLLNLQRLLESTGDRDQLLNKLVQQPRTVEILVKLFVGSQFLTEILLRNPHYLDRLTTHKRLAEFKSRADFVEHGRRDFTEGTTIAEAMDYLRRFQQWEFLRLAACDSFGLMDLKNITLQLALLADGIVQIALEFLAAAEGLSLDQFVVVAMGKLGGEELNYSSDIDLVFICDRDAERFWGLGQKLIRVLSESTGQGFLYRVDLRLRPWGNAGALVTTIDNWAEYLNRSGQLWEKQALLKARPIAGNLQLGEQALARLQPSIFHVDIDAVRKSIRGTKEKIEESLRRRGVKWGEVKAGPGGIRDIEFVVQFLQLVYGGEIPEVRCLNTLEGLVRLAEMKLLFPEEFRRLTEGYLVLRTIEHALQLMHNKQEHTLPRSERHLDYLARRLDFPDSKSFLEHYEQHSRSVREIFERYLHHDQHPMQPSLDVPASQSTIQFGNAAESYHAVFSPTDEELHAELLSRIDAAHVIRIHVANSGEDYAQLTVVGVDRIGELAAICGLLFTYGLDIVYGNVFTWTEATTLVPIGNPDLNSDMSWRFIEKKSPRKFVNVFHVRRTGVSESPFLGADRWEQFESELNELLLLSDQRGLNEAQGRIARRVAETMEAAPRSAITLFPFELELDNESDVNATILHIQGEDSPGFLYELTNAITISGLSITRMMIRSSGNRVIDTLYVVDEHHQRIQHADRLNELRAAIVLIKHFTHFLPQSPNPGSALIHFQQFLENLFRQPNWLEQLSPLQDSEVLGALAALLGISDFLWDDFLRLQHENLFPVVTNVDGLQQPRDRESLEEELHSLLAKADEHQKLDVLNAFKDREMMRSDMRHILGLQDKFGMFGRELTTVAEVTVDAAREICEQTLQAIHGCPRTSSGAVAQYCLCALGKFGGRELGYASDIELMFLFQGDGQTDGREVVSNAEYFERFVHEFRRSIRSKRKGIFEIDLRLRPYGKAGPLAVSLSTFESYFGPGGEAWPYERQMLVKLRPVAGSKELGRQIVAVRDALIYRGEPFNVAAMKAMREKQIRQLIRPGTFNAKLSPGGLVDCEYVVQGLQITFGHLDKAIREPNTREAMKALESYGLLPSDIRVGLRDAYRFFRRVIDGLRVVRGDASDLTVPPFDCDEFVFLARRLGYSSDVKRLQQDFERHTQHVQLVAAALPEMMKQEPSAVSRRLRKEK